MEDWLLPETSRAGITRIGCKGSLSALPPRHEIMQPAGKAPLFRRRPLDHKSRGARKRAALHHARFDPAPIFCFVETDEARALAQCLDRTPRDRGAGGTHGRPRAGGIEAKESNAT
jgi:hypothetical protein